MLSDDYENAKIHNYIYIFAIII